jgi:hypothetical protein
VRTLRPTQNRSDNRTASQANNQRYDQLMKLVPPVPIMPVIQGYRVSEYLAHLYMYQGRLAPGAGWELVQFVAEMENQTKC